MGSARGGGGVKKEGQGELGFWLAPELLCDLEQTYFPFWPSVFPLQNKDALESPFEL